jgi:Cu+-exporting ATPase
MFAAVPARYTIALTDNRDAAAGPAPWTCPMHPQIVREEPGNCPTCGMALELLTPSVEDAANPELRDMTRRFWIGVGLVLPLLAIAMAEYFDKPALDILLSPRLAA